MAARSEIDLHSHSTASDGVLSPSELVARAATGGVRVFALTDHDTTAGVDEAATAAQAHGVQLIPAVEVSSLWESREIHVVGLGVDPSHQVLRQGLAWNQEQRRSRIRSMARRLEERAGIGGVMEAMEPRPGNQPGRGQLARFLVEQGYCRSTQQAFDRYLRRGRPGYQRAGWMALATAVSLIRQAGGVAVLAHPLAYKMTGAWMRRLLTAFREAGGGGVEVVVGTSDRQRVDQVLGYALRFDLLASMGSDFHGPGPAGVEPGRLLPMPAAASPVWKDLRDVRGRVLSPLAPSQF